MAENRNNLNASSDNKTYLVTFKPDPNISDAKTQSAYNRIKDFRNDIQGKKVGFTTNDLKDVLTHSRDLNKTLPPGITPNEIQAGIDIWLKGGDGNQLISRAESVFNPDSPQLDSFIRVGFVTAALQTSNISGAPTQEDIALANGNPTLDIEQVNYLPENNSRQTALSWGGSDFKMVWPGADKITDAVKNKVLTGLKTGASKLLGSPIANKAGVTAAVGFLKKALPWIASAIPGVGPVLAGAIKLITPFLGRILNGIGNWIHRNKELVATGGALALGFGAPALGIGLLGSLLLTGGWPLVLGGIGGAAAIGWGLFVAAVTYASILGTVLSIFVGFILLTTFTLLVINSGAYVTSPNQFLGIGAVVCSTEKTPVAFPNNASGIAGRAWEIADDLYQGFWCFWNRSPVHFPTDTVLHPPSYPEVFNLPLYLSNPNPTRGQVEGSAMNLFWCTWLVNQSYKETGNPQSGDYNSERMLLWYKDKGRFWASNLTWAIHYGTTNVATPSRIVPGAVVFFKFEGGPDRANHVAIVHNTDCGNSLLPCTANFVQSNAGTKEGNLSFVPVIGASYAGAEILGFGLP